MRVSELEGEEMPLGQLNNKATNGERHASYSLHVNQETTRGPVY
jgi:hypothetical protein